MLVLGIEPGTFKGSVQIMFDCYLYFGVPIYDKSFSAKFWCLRAHLYSDVIYRERHLAKTQPPPAFEIPFQHAVWLLKHYVY